MEYARPVLCRFCGFPAPDGGVPVSQVDREKLSEWCLRMMDTELDQEGLEKAVFCYFCVAESRFEHENSKLKMEKPTIWWSGIKKFKCEKYFCEENLIQPCAVLIENLSKNQIIKAMNCPKLSMETQKNLGKVQNKYYAIFCSSTKPTQHSRNYQKISNSYSEDYKSKNVKKFENKSVSRKVTDKEDLLKCKYCPRIFHRATLFYHIKNSHKLEAIKCNFNKKCPTYFQTEEEKQEHIQKVHKAKFLQQFQCVYCKKPFWDLRCLRNHVDQKHPKVKIKCRWPRKCSQYFLTQEEHQQHFEKVHAQKEEQRLLFCHYCQHSTFYKPDLRFHILRKHGGQSLKCPRCPRILTSQFALKEHSKTHADDAKSRCEFCQKSFSQLRKHKVKRQCKFCNCVFSCLGLHSKHFFKCKIKSAKP